MTKKAMGAFTKHRPQPASTLSSSWAYHISGSTMVEAIMAAGPLHLWPRAR